MQSKGTLFVNFDFDSFGQFRLLSHMGVVDGRIRMLQPQEKTCDRPRFPSLVSAAVAFYPLLSGVAFPHRVIFTVEGCRSDVMVVVRGGWVSRYSYGSVVWVLHKDLHHAWSGTVRRHYCMREIFFRGHPHRMEFFMWYVSILLFFGDSVYHICTTF